MRRLASRTRANTREPPRRPDKVFDLTLPLDQVAEGYRAMDERRAIKALLCP
jgi:threonine dehydrogenase-like Zn-dependent dehydrogenase